MRSTLLLPVLLSLLFLGTTANAQQASESDSDYLQNRAASLNERIDTAVKHRQVSKKQATKLHLSVGQVQTLAGNLQARHGAISRQEADEMNQTLTNVERTLTHQP